MTSERVADLVHMLLFAWFPKYEESSMVDPVATLAVARTALQLAHAAGLVQTATDKALERVETKLRQLLEAPLHEGLDRVKMAASIGDERRKAELLSEARSKLHDAVARQGMPPLVVALASVTSAALARFDGRDDEARIWMTRALDAYDQWLVSAQSEAERAAKAARQATKYLGKPSRAEKYAMALMPSTAAQVLGRDAYITSAHRRVASRSLVSDVNAQVLSALTFARELGVDTTGRCMELTVTRKKSIVVATDLKLDDGSTAAPSP